MQANAITSYCRAVERRMDLPRAERRRLLLGLQQELEQNDSAGVPLQTLTDEFGEPADVARTLMDGVDMDEQVRYRKKKKRVVVAIISLLLVLLAAVSLYFYVSAKHWPVYTRDTITVYETVDEGGERIEP